MVPPSRIDILEVEVARALRLTEQTVSLVIMQTETIKALADTSKEIGIVLKELNDKIKGFDTQIKWLEAAMDGRGGPLQ